MRITTVFKAPQEPEPQPEAPRKREKE